MHPFIDRKPKVWRRRRRHDPYVSTMLRRRHKTGHRCDEYLAILSMSKDINKFFTCVKILYHFSICVRICYRFFTPEKKVTPVILRCDEYLPIFIYMSEIINMRKVSKNFRPQNLSKLTVQNDKFTVQQVFLWIELQPNTAIFA